MYRAELGQHTASGISFTGVKQIPPSPQDSFTPEKNKPITALSTVMESTSSPRIDLMWAMVSRSMPDLHFFHVFNSHPLLHQNDELICW
jgi:hypothetical protein